MKTYENCVMVCVTPQKSCARLIEEGAKIAEKRGIKLSVISVVSNFSEETTSALNELYQYVENYNADMNLYVNSEPVLTTAVAAKRFNAKYIITGFPGERSSMFISDLQTIIPDIPLIMVDDNGTQYRMTCSSEENYEALV